MSIIGTNDSRTAALYQTWNKPSTTQTANHFGQTLGQTQTANQSGQSQFSSRTNSTQGLGSAFATYNSQGQVFNLSRPKDLSETFITKESLTDSVRNAVDGGYEVSQENLAKLTGDDTQDFLEGLAEVTGKTPAQVMTAVMNMDPSEIAGLSYQLERLTGVGKEAFVPMLSKLTGHSQAMIMQCLNSEEEDSEDKNQFESATQLDHHRDLKSVEYPSVNVTV